MQALQSQMIKKWWQVVSKFDTDEKRLFVGIDGKSGLARSKFKWRSIKALANEAGLTRTRIEEILDKYLNAGLVFQSDEDPDKFGYWENLTTTKKKRTIVDKDHNDRINTALGGGVTKAKVKTVKAKSGKTTAKKKATP